MPVLKITQFLFSIKTGIFVRKGSGGREQKKVSSVSNQGAQVLQENNISLLRELEVEKWKAEGASVVMLESRIKNAPGYSWGFFENGKILGSCFVMGSSKEKILNAKDWYVTTDNGLAITHNKKSKIWFGISLSGDHDKAVISILAKMYSKILRDGIQEVYLGAPIPGFQKWKRKNPEKTAHDYVKLYRTNDPYLKHVDPLLSYYMHYGFEIVSLKENYFPHEKAENYGVLICYKNPIWYLAPLIRLVPQKLLHAFVERIAKRYM